MNLWWQTRNLSFLEQVCNKINIANLKDNPVEKYPELCNALNLVWNDYYVYRRSIKDLTKWEMDKGRTDSTSFEELLLKGLELNQKKILCKSKGLETLAALSPQIMDHSVLLDREYNPKSIPPLLVKDSQKKHAEFLEEYECRKSLSFQGNHGDLKNLLIKLAKLLYMVRSNIAHGNKTSQGPDEAKAERDKSICQIICPILQSILDLIFDNPVNRLLVYGTLAPGQVNEKILSGIPGIWTEGFVKGMVETRNGLPEFKWRTNSDEIKIKVFNSDVLVQHIEKINKFEGSNYRRILIPVRVSPSLFSVGFIYEFCIATEGITNVAADS